MKVQTDRAIGAITCTLIGSHESSYTGYNGSTFLSICGRCGAIYNPLQSEGKGSK